MAGEGELLLVRLRREVHRRARVAPLDEVEIVGAGSRTEAGAGGAALWRAGANPT